MGTGTSGLRERKKAATHRAIREAALRLALARGADKVRVEDIATEAGVSARTYNNYFSSREQAIVAAVIGAREASIAASVASASSARLSDAVIGAVVEHYTEPHDHERDMLAMIASAPALRAAYLDAAALMKEPLAHAMTMRSSGMDRLTARVLAASVAAATRVALDEWLQPASLASTQEFLIPSGPLDETLRRTLAPLAPALDEAARPA
jgi:AcrR family transcriptional regulator